MVLAVNFRSDDIALARLRSELQMFLCSISITATVAVTRFRKCSRRAIDPLFDGVMGQHHDRLPKKAWGADTEALCW